MRRVVWLLSSFLISLLLAASFIAMSNHKVQADQNSSQINKLDPDLQILLSEAGPGQPIDAIVYLNDPEIGDVTLPSKGYDSRQSVVNHLKLTAENSQANLVSRLELYRSMDRVVDYRSLWIVNAVQVVADVSTISELAARPEVVRVGINASHQYISATQALAGAPPSGPTWGLERIRADDVNHGLGISGTGVTVAVMDTGIDWSHPALIDNYRGLQQGKPINHVYNWFDAIDGSDSPIDPHGHGTHVAGTAVGNLGIGVAPGAKWIAVRILDEQGIGNFADIHAGFQWLLAPGGDPNLSPDIVNNSWSGSPDSTEFMPDLEALRAAGIVPVFAAGNSGPASGSVRSPANYLDTVAVGASDDLDLVAWFSARGPSLLTEAVKPIIVAPGANILSSLPGGEYGYFNGTSMATPHVVGLFALLLSADPTLDQTDLLSFVTSTAVSLDDNYPNHDSGWGRIDAYAAATQLTVTGRVQGSITAENTVVPNAIINLIAPSGHLIIYQSDDAGNFEAEMKPGTYEMTISKSGYHSHYQPGIVIAGEQTTSYDVDLTRLPYGNISGQVLSSDSLKPVTATIRIDSLSLVISTDDVGFYSSQLPVGNYELVAFADGYRITRHQINVGTNSSTIQDISLESSPKILLIDSGRWYYDQQIEFYMKALEQNDYAYTLWTLSNPFEDSPSAEDLATYDIVIWSAPNDAPWQTGAANSLSEYLEGGGKLFVSGQNIAELNNIPFILGWWQHQLQGRYLSAAEEPYDIIGAAGYAFASMEFNLNGAGSADNQTTPDSSQPALGSLTEIIFHYPDGTAAGLQAHRCEPYRILYLGFGLEGVDGEENRKQIISRGMDFFADKETEVGIYFDPSEVDDIVPLGAQRSYTIDILNLSETITDTIKLTADNSSWPTSIVTDTLTLGPCKSAKTTISVSIPEDVPKNSTTTLNIMASSENDQSYSRQLPIHLQTAGQILLVDDDRWYDQESTYRTALDSTGLQYDFWDIGASSDGRGSPPGDLLNEYEVVLWYTGYDWFRPITDSEEMTIYEYLAQGGRLFLTSQDYLYYHSRDSLTRDYLGVAEYVESIGPTRIYGNDQFNIGEKLIGPQNLDYAPYQNFSDGLIPTYDNQVFFWHEKGMPGGVANAGADWRSVFLAFPLEKLPANLHPEYLSQILGWLGDLGDSSFEVDQRVSPLNNPLDSVRTFTITLRNINSGMSQNVTVNNPLPDDLIIDEGSISGGARDDQRDRLLIWEGRLGSGSIHSITYRARVEPGLPAGFRIDNQVSLFYDHSDIRLDLVSPVWIQSSDLSESFISFEPAQTMPGEPFTIVVNLVNSGSASSEVSASLTLPEVLQPVSPTLEADKGVIEISGQDISWRGKLGTGESAQLSLVTLSEFFADPIWLPVMMVIEDGASSPQIRYERVYIRPYQLFFPWMPLLDR